MLGNSATVTIPYQQSVVIATQLIQCWQALIKLGRFISDIFQIS